MWVAEERSCVVCSKTSGSIGYIISKNVYWLIIAAITLFLSHTFHNPNPFRFSSISPVVYVSSMLALGFMGVLANVIIIKVNRWEAEGRWPNNSTLQNNKRTFKCNSGVNKDTNQSSTLLQDGDGTSNQSESKTIESPHCFDKSGSCTGPCKRRVAYFLNKFFLFLNGSVVLILTIGLWVLIIRWNDNLLRLLVGENKTETKTMN